jgi:hypothetical protein
MRNLRNCFSFLLSLIFLWGHSLEAAPSFDMYIPKLKIMSSNGLEEMKQVQWPNKVTSQWKKNLDGGMEFFWVVQLVVPLESEIITANPQFSEVFVRPLEGKVTPPGEAKPADPNAAEAKPADAKTPEVKPVDAKPAEVKPVPAPPAVKPKNQTIMVSMRSISDKITIKLKDDTVIEVQLELLFKSTPMVINEKCPENYLKIIPKSADDLTSDKIDPSLMPPYFALRCDPTSNGLNLAVTFPKEVKWNSCSLFESKGKGKNWKNFELSPQTMTGGYTDIGSFGVEYNDSELKYFVQLEKTELARPISLFRLSLGMINLGIKNGPSNVQDSKLASFINFETRPFSNRLGLGAEILTSIPKPTSSGLFSHTESVGYLGLTVVSKKTWLLEPRVYWYLAEGVSQSLQLYYGLNTFTIGGYFQIDINVKHRIGFETFYIKTPDQSIVSNRLLYSRPSENKMSAWGLLIMSQTIGMNLSNVITGKGTHLYVGPFLEF